MPIGSNKIVGTENYGAQIIPVIAANLVLLMADVGDASAATLGSIYGILGNPAISVSSMLSVPPKDSALDVYMRDAVGKKDDTAVVAVGTDASLMGYTKGILNTVLALGNNAYRVTVYGPQFLDVDNSGRFEAIIMDDNSGLIPLADITAGTYDIVRTRAGVDTTIVSGGAWSKANGKVYIDYTFATASWDTDDTFKVASNNDTTIVIGGITYYIGIPCMSGYVGDVSTIEGKVDSLLADVGDASASTLGSILAIAGNPGTDSLSAQIGADGIDDIATQIGADGLDSIATQIGADGLDSIAAQIGCDGVQAVNLQLGYGASSSVAAELGSLSGLTLLNLAGVLGDPAQTVTAMLGNGAAGVDSLSAQIGADGLDSIAAQIGADGLDSLAAQIGCDGVASVNTQLGYGAAGSVAATLGSPLKSAAPSTISLILGDPGASDLATLISAIPTSLVDISALALQADLGDASGDTLTSVNAKLGDPATTFAAQIAAIPTNPMLDTEDGSSFTAIPAPTDMALDSTVAKEATLGTPVSDIYTEMAKEGADGDTLETLSDQMDGLAAQTGAAASAGTFSYIDAGGEQDVIELTPTKCKEIVGIWLDLVNMTQDGTIKAYFKIDGTNYREFYSDNFAVATDSDGWYININCGINDDFKVTYTEGANEGAARDIPYRIVYKNLEA